MAHSDDLPDLPGFWIPPGRRPDWDDQPAHAVIHEPPEEPMPAMSHELSRQDADLNRARELAELMENELKLSKKGSGDRRRFDVRSDTTVKVLLLALSILGDKMSGLRYDLTVRAGVLQVIF